MVEDSDYNRGNLKRRLIKEGMLLPVCSKCGVGEEWLGEPLTLILDHINGVNRDHRRENLRLLCPNCNSQTTTFSGRNMQNRRKRRLCSECGSAVSKGAFVCQKCHLSRLHETNAASYKVVPGERPSLDDIRKMKKTMSWGEIGKMYGVSDTAVKKWVRVAGGDVKEFGDRRHRRRLSEVA
jgi:RNA polymerase subunit RPABC4/transcription elongation factor Spt4